MMSFQGNQDDADQIVLVHLSDLHVGTSLMPPPDAYELVAGYNPHDVLLLRMLDLALLDVRKRFHLAPNERLNVVISGDLTQSGTKNDYATVTALLYCHWQWRLPPNKRSLGFGWTREQLLTVPGNHDHWGREHRAIAFRQGLSPDYFATTPWKNVLSSRGGTINLELYGVDSNSGLEDSANPAKGNLFAGGKLSPEELFGLEEQLKLTDLGERTGAFVVRALVCHHALSPDGILNAWPLDEGSRRKLLDIAGRYRICAALTGHTHRFHVEDWSLSVGGHGVLKELRCGTTLQATGGAGLQGFWVHRIARQAGRPDCEWTAWKYQKGGTSFDVNTVDTVRFTVPAIQPA
jgi:3',5'-cyclic AMP phosphodiesterase CpdA